ncbi:four-helix bundle copper-binding protein [Burkholderia diffusa]
MCDACATECEKHQHAHCKECAQSCRRCAQECRTMVQ